MSILLYVKPCTAVYSVKADCEYMKMTFAAFDYRHSTLFKS